MNFSEPELQESWEDNRSPGSSVTSAGTDVVLGGGKNISAVRGFIAAADLSNKHSAERYNSNRFNSYHWALV